MPTNTMPGAHIWCCCSTSKTFTQQVTFGWKVHQQLSLLFSATETYLVLFWRRMTLLWNPWGIWMWNMKFTCALAFFADDTKESNHYNCYSVCNGWIYGVSRIGNTWIFCKSKVVVNFVFCCIEQYVRLLFKFFYDSHSSLSVSEVLYLLMWSHLLTLAIDPCILQSKHCT